MSSGDFNTVLYSPPDYIIDVISSQKSKRNSRARWTISDVSVKSGKDLNIARRDLLNLATATGSCIMSDWKCDICCYHHVRVKLLLGAVLEVTDDGEVMYSFPANWKRLLQQRSIARQFKTKFDEVSPLLWTVFRGTFGTALVASLVFLAIAIIVVQSSGSSSSSSSSDSKSSDSYSSSSASSSRLIGDLFDVVRTIRLLRNRVPYIICTLILDCKELITIPNLYKQRKGSYDVSRYMLLVSLRRWRSELRFDARTIISSAIHLNWVA